MSFCAVSFSGYENQDWFIPSPALKPEETVLSPDQIRETLNYFREYIFFFNCKCFGRYFFFFSMKYSATIPSILLPFPDSFAHGDHVLSPTCGKRALQFRLLSPETQLPSKAHYSLLSSSDITLAEKIWNEATERFFSVNSLLI